MGLNGQRNEGKVQQVVQQQTKRKPIRITPAEARAIRFILSLGWADYEAMNDSDLEGYRIGKRWLKLAQSANDKIYAIQRKK